MDIFKKYQISISFVKSGEGLEVLDWSAFYCFGASRREIKNFLGTLVLMTVVQVGIPLTSCVRT